MKVVEGINNATVCETWQDAKALSSRASMLLSAYSYRIVPHPKTDLVVLAIGPGFPGPLRYVTDAN